MFQSDNKNCGQKSTVHTRAKMGKCVSVICQSQVVLQQSSLMNQLSFKLLTQRSLHQVTNEALKNFTIHLLPHQLAAKATTNSPRCSMYLKMTLVSFAYKQNACRCVVA